MKNFERKSKVDIPPLGIAPANSSGLERIGPRGEGQSSPIFWDQIDTDALVTAFRLLPMETSDEVHKKFMRQIFPVFSKKLFKERYGRGEEDRFDYTGKQRFLQKLAYVILSSKVEDIEAYLKPFLNDFKDSKDAAEFFSEFIGAEDRLAQYEQFWTVWKLFYPKVAALAQGKGSRFYSKEIRAREWHSSCFSQIVIRLLVVIRHLKFVNRHRFNFLFFLRFFILWLIFCNFEQALSFGKPEIFNTDQGSQFTSIDFTKILLNSGVQISMDGKGRVFGEEIVTLIFMPFAAVTSFISHSDRLD